MNYLLKIRFLYFACFGRYFGQISDSMYVYIEGFSTIIVVGIVIDATQMVLGKSLKYRAIKHLVHEYSPKYLDQAYSNSS